MEQGKIKDEKARERIEELMKENNDLKEGKIPQVSEEIIEKQKKE